MLILLFMKDFKAIYGRFFVILTFLVPPILIEFLLKYFFEYASGVGIRIANGLLLGILFYYIFLFVPKYLTKFENWTDLFLNLKSSYSNLLKLKRAALLQKLR